MTPFLRRLSLGLVLPLGLLAAGPARAAELPPDARIVFDVLYGSGEVRIGRAEQRWHVEEGRYELQTELIPLLGSRVRYVSRGRVAPAGLLPDSFAEYRGRDGAPRSQAQFDWSAQVVRYGRGDERREAALEAGAQDVNALAYQLGALGPGWKGGSLQVATGKKVAAYRFAKAPATRVTVNGQGVSATPWRSLEGGDRTEVWIAPQLGHLPVRIMRVDDDQEIRFVARDVQFTPARRSAP